MNQPCSLRVGFILGERREGKAGGVGGSGGGVRDLPGEAGLLVEGLLLHLQFEHFQTFF